jgi:hypothetical protein
MQNRLHCCRNFSSSRGIHSSADIDVTQSALRLCDSSAATAPAAVSPVQSTDARHGHTSCRSAARTDSICRPPCFGWRAADDLSAPRFRRQITEHVILLLIVSAHAFSYQTRLWIWESFFSSLLGPQGWSHLGLPCSEELKQHWL